MKSTIKITATELRLLFYSPFSWLVFIVFFSEFAFVFVHHIQIAALEQATGLNSTGLTGAIFSSNSDENAGVLALVSRHLYFYFPLLTMGAISKEYGSHTFTLLISSPLKTCQVVFGKFLPLLVFSLLLLFTLGCLMMVSVEYIPNLDIGHILAGFFGIFLLMITYSSVGLFMSSLTEYPVVAAIGTFAVFFSLEHLSEIFNNNSFVGIAAGYLKLAKQTNQFCRGLISTDNIFYYLIIIALFLFFTWLVMELRSGHRLGFSFFTRILVVIFSVGIISRLSAVPQFIFYWDTTKNQENTIFPATQQAIKKLTNPISVRAYDNILDEYAWIGMPYRMSDNQFFFQPYQRFMPALKLDYTYYYAPSTTDDVSNARPQTSSLKDKAIETARMFKLSFNETLNYNKLKNSKALSSENYRFLWQVTSGQRSKFLRVFDDILVYPSDNEITATIFNLDGFQPTILSLEGNGERSSNDPSDIGYTEAFSRKSKRVALINQGFSIKSTIPDSICDHKEDNTILIIAAPRIPFEAREIQKVKTYIDNGGDLMILGEPGDNSILKPFSSLLGVEWSNDTLFRPVHGFQRQIIKTTFPNLNRLFTDSYTFDLGEKYPLILSGACAIRILKSSFSCDTVASVDQVPVVITLKRKLKSREQRICITGDADIFSNDVLSRKDLKGSNQNTLNGIFNWFTRGRLPYNETLKPVGDEIIHITNAQLIVWTIILIAIIPAILVLVACLIIYKRKTR